MNEILVGKGERPVHLLAKYANRHGMVAGATGTGKTVSLLVLAEGFSRLGVPVFMADVKGDVAGLAMPGLSNDKIQQRAKDTGAEGYTNEACPVLFWDLYGKLGHPIRTTISDMGPTLLGRILELSDVQAGVLEIAFKLADDQGLLLLDLDDLRTGRRRDRLDVGPVRRLRVGHDRRRVAVDQNDLEPLGAQRLAGLGPRVVELTGLADDDRTGADDQDTFQIGAAGHGVDEGRMEKTKSEQ